MLGDIINKDEAPTLLQVDAYLDSQWSHMVLSFRECWGPDLPAVLTAVVPHLLVDLALDVGLSARVAMAVPVVRSATEGLGHPEVDLHLVTNDGLGQLLAERGEHIRIDDGDLVTELSESAIERLLGDRPEQHSRHLPPPCLPWLGFAEVDMPTAVSWSGSSKPHWRVVSPDAGVPERR